MGRTHRTNGKDSLGRQPIGIKEYLNSTCSAQTTNRDKSSGVSSAKTAAMSSAADATVWKTRCDNAPAYSVPSTSLPPVN